MEFYTVVSDQCLMVGLLVLLGEVPIHGGEDKGMFDGHHVDVEQRCVIGCDPVVDQDWDGW